MGSGIGGQGGRPHPCDAIDQRRRRHEWIPAFAGMTDYAQRDGERLVKKGGWRVVGGKPFVIDVSSIHPQLFMHLLGAASTLVALPRLALGIEQLRDAGQGAWLAVEAGHSDLLVHGQPIEQAVDRIAGIGETVAGGQPPSIGGVQLFCRSSVLSMNDDSAGCRGSVFIRLRLPYTERRHLSAGGT